MKGTVAYKRVEERERRGAGAEWGRGGGRGQREND